MIESVEGMISAPPNAHQRAGDDQLGGGCGVGPEQARPGEHQESELQEPLAAEAVAEGPHGEQEPGEDDDVGVDDPLQRRRRRAQLPLQRRDGDVDDRVVDDDDQQAHRQDRQGPPAAPVDLPLASFQLRGPAAAALVVRGHRVSFPGRQFRTSLPYRLDMPY
jgi:hypothetical protein